MSNGLERKRMGPVGARLLVLSRNLPRVIEEKHDNRNSVSWWHGKSQIGLFPNVSHKFLTLCQVVS